MALMMPGSLEQGLANGFNPQFLPRLDGIMTLLSRRATTASAWVHIACINLFVARFAALDAVAIANGGRLHRIAMEGDAALSPASPPPAPRRAVPLTHTLALALIAGPLGLLSHVVTRYAVEKNQRRVEGQHGRVRDDGD